MQIRVSYFTKNKDTKLKSQNNKIIIKSYKWKQNT